MIMRSLVLFDPLFLFPSLRSCLKVTLENRAMITDFSRKITMISTDK